LFLAPIKTENQYSVWIIVIFEGMKRMILVRLICIHKSRLVVFDQTYPQITHNAYEKISSNSDFILGCSPIKSITEYNNKWSHSTISRVVEFDKMEIKS
jgi:hypothetical protein